STTTQGGQTSKIVNTWDSGNSVVIAGSTIPVVFGSLWQKDEYDFSNTLVRSTVNHFLWQDNATYKSKNFLNLPVSSTLKDGTGNQVAQTTYTYDQGTLASSGIGLPTHVVPPAGEPYRGHLTMVNHWLNTTNTLIPSTSTYFDTGMKASSTDPLNHTTTYTYSSIFAGAYLTQTNLPDTQMPDSGAPIVHHIISGNYDFNTGLLTTFTDENLQNYTYTYDIMLLLTQGNHPDGGQTLFTYPNVTTVERQRLITGPTYDDYKVLFDGLGRPIQTQQATPDCTSKIKVDTVYDVAGRVASVSNPYCLTTEATYGTTQNQHDALSRSTKTIKQDGSFTTVKYEDTPGDPSGAPLVCTTVTDEAGKQRQTCTDALGRLAKVLEQNPGAPATSATGSVIVSGMEQSTGGAATSGSGTLTINSNYGSSDGSYCPVPTCPPHALAWDTGSVTAS